MIIDLPETTTAAVNRKLIELRETGGAVALGRVMTLVISTEDGHAEEAIRAANDASREHPCRVIAIVRGSKRGSSRLDAQIRVGGDAGASEVIVLRLYGPLSDHGQSVVVPLLLPDAPTVAWWPGSCPESPSLDPIGRMAQRRITDAARGAKPIRLLTQRAKTYADGDTDLAWSRITLWRALIAAALDEPPFEPVTEVVVTGGSDSPSSELLAGWLALKLRCPVHRERTEPGTGMISVRLERATGPIVLERPDGNVARLTQPGQPDRRVSLVRRSDRDCLVEELRRLDPDDIYREVLTRGLQLLAKPVAAPRKAATVKAATERALAATEGRPAGSAAVPTPEVAEKVDAELADAAAAAPSVTTSKGADS